MNAKALGLAGALFMVLAGGAVLARDAPYLGAWARDDGKTRIRVERCESSVCAFNTWVKPGMRGEKVGDRLVLKIAPAGASSWSGRAFDPQRNQSYTVKVSVANRRMTTSGCAMGGLFCQSMTWSRLRQPK